MPDQILLQLFLFAASTAYQISQNNKMKREADKRKGFAVTVSGEAASIPVVYGKAVLGGIETKHKVTNSFNYATGISDGTFVKDFASTTRPGSKNEYLHVQYALATEGIEGVQWVKVNGLHYNSSIEKFKHFIRTFNTGGTADPIATVNIGEANNKFTNTSWASATFQLNRDDYNYNGVPQMEFLVKGRKVRWIQESNGVYTLSTEYIYSNNPALCLLDYLTNVKFGRGLTVDEIDLESFYHAAEICDTIVATDRITAGKVNGQKVVNTVADLGSRPTDLEKHTYENELWYTTATSQYWYWNKTAWVETTYDTTRPIPLYECNITLDTSEKIRDNVERIMSTMGLAELTWSSEGKYKLLLEHPDTLEATRALVDSNHHFTDDDIIRDQINMSWPEASSRLNRATVSFLNEHEDFKEDSISWPPVNSTIHNEYLTEDNNQPFESELNLEGVTDPYHALAMAEQAVRKSRTIFTLDLTVSKKGLSLEPGDFINVTSELTDISNEVFRVQSIEVNSDFTVKLSCYKYDHNALAWNVNDDIAYVEKPVFDFTLSPPTELEFNNTASILGTASGKLSWEAANDISAIEYLIEISSDGGLTWETLGVTRATTFDVVGLVSGVYDFSVRARSPVGTLSTRVLVEDETIQLKTVSKVAIIYADTEDESNNTQSYTLGTNEYVAYYEYDSDLPTLPILSNISFTKFVGIDGDPGVGVASITRSGETVTVTYDDNTTQTFTVSDGLDGDGLNRIYIGSENAPSTPAASAGIPSGWSTTLPTAINNVWASDGFRTNNTGDYTWSAPQLLSKITSNAITNQGLSWEAGSGSATHWISEGATSESLREYDTDPFGGESLIWKSINKDTFNNDEGGFSGGHAYVDITKLHRISIFVKQEDNVGIKYVGVHGRNDSLSRIAMARVSDGFTTIDGAYAFSGDLPQNDKWYLVVFHVRPNGSTITSNHPDSGIYELDTGQKLTYPTITDWRINSTYITRLSVRGRYTGDTTTTENKVYWFEPRIDILDGKAPSVTEILRTVQKPVIVKIDLVTNNFVTKNPDNNTYDANELDFDVEATQGGILVAKRRYRILRNSDTWTAAAYDRDSVTSDELNTSRLSTSVSVNSKSFVLTVNYSYSNSSASATRGGSIIVNGATGDSGDNAELVFDKEASYTSTSDNTPESAGELFFGSSTNPNFAYSGSTWPSRYYLSINKLASTGDIEEELRVATYEDKTITFYEDSENYAVYRSDSDDSSGLVSSQNYYYMYIDKVSSKGNFNYLGDYTVGVSNSARGAGWWRYETGNSSSVSNLIQSDVNAFFATAVGRAPVLGDRLILVNTSEEVTAYLYSLDNGGYLWVSQEAFIDGNLLVSGTVTASKVAVNTLSAISATLGQVDITDNLRLTGKNSGFIAGRTDQSTYNDNGFYIGRESRLPVNAGSFIVGEEYAIASVGTTDFTLIGSSSNSVGTVFKATGVGSGTGTASFIGFEVSHTSVIDNKIQGIIHSEERGLQIINPVIFTGGSASGGTSTLTSTQTVNAGDAGENITISVYGGGGAGGYGLDDGYLSTSYNTSGTSTTVEVWAGDPQDTGSVNLTPNGITANGGAGGLNAKTGYPWRGEAGEASIFGNGGIGAAGQQQVGGDSLSFSAGGGGAGGDQDQIFDSSGGAGLGGKAGEAITEVIDTSSYIDVKQIFIKVTAVGVGGVSSGGNYRGGTGGGGAVTFSSIFGGTEQYTAGDLAMGSGTWNNVIRTTTGTYQNTRGKPICIYYKNYYGGGKILINSVNDRSTARVIDWTDGSSDLDGGSTFMIPKDYYYWFDRVNNPSSQPIIEMF